MFIPAHRVEGQLLAPLTSSALTMELDTQAAAYLAAAISGGNHTYLMLDAGGPAKEVVRATGVLANTVTIERGMDAAAAMAFSATTPVRYVFVSAAIPDILLGAPSNIVNINSYGSINVTQNGPNDFTLEGLWPNAYNNNGTMRITGSNSQNIELSVNADALGCCGEPTDYYSGGQ